MKITSIGRPLPSTVARTPGKLVPLPPAPKAGAHEDRHCTEGRANRAVFAPFQFWKSHAPLVDSLTICRPHPRSVNSAHSSSWPPSCPSAREIGALSGKTGILAIRGSWSSTSQMTPEPVRRSRISYALTACSMALATNSETQPAPRRWSLRLRNRADPRRNAKQYGHVPEHRKCIWPSTTPLPGHHPEPGSGSPPASCSHDIAASCDTAVMAPPGTQVILHLVEHERANCFDGRQQQCDSEQNRYHGNDLR